MRGVDAQGWPTFRFVVDGAPATKKNQSRIVRHRATGRTFILPSEKAVRWQRMAASSLAKQGKVLGLHTLTGPVNVQALVYRKANYAGDLVNYQQAIADALEEAKIVENDRQIAGWDGSRLSVSKGRPRVELLVTEVDPALWFPPIEELVLLD